MAVKKSLTFEKAMSRLDEISSKLDSGEPELEEALTLFSEGAELVAFCGEKLKTARLTVEKLFGGDNAPDGTDE